MCSPRAYDLSRRVVRLLETKNTLPRTVPLSAEATALFQKALANPIRPIDIDLIFFGEPGKDEKRRPYNFNKVWLDIKRTAGCASPIWLVLPAAAQANHCPVAPAHAAAAR